MNPLTRDDVVNRTRYLLDPEYLVTTFTKTHKALHYGDETYLLQFSGYRERAANDTSPWKQFRGVIDGRKHSCIY